MSAIPNWVEKQWEWCLFRVRYAGRYQLAGSRQMNGRTLWTYFAVHEGKLWVNAFGFDRTVTAGQTIVLPPYRRGQHRSLDTRRPVVATEIGFSVAPSLSHNNPLTHLGRPLAVTQPNNVHLQTWCAQVESCFRKWQPVDETATLRARCWLELLLLLHLKTGFDTDTFANAVQQPVPGWVQVMAERIRAGVPWAGVKPHGLHRLGGFCRSHVTAVFKKHMGETPTRYLHRCRTQLAMEQLAGFPEMPLSEIANACGYATQSLFGRHFLKIAGMTPGKFRHVHKASGKL